MPKTYNPRPLVGQIRKLASLLQGLGQTSDLDRLIRLILQKGHTTPAEHVFEAEIVDALLAQAEALASLKQGLLAGSQRVTPSA